MSEATTSNPEQLGPDELRILFLFEALGFLFEALGDEPLDWLASNVRVEIFPAGSLVYGEGEDATCFFVLPTGTLPMHRQVEDTEMEITWTSQRGAYAVDRAGYQYVVLHEGLRARSRCSLLQDQARVDHPGQGARARPASHPGRPGRVQPVLDEPGRQRHPGHAGRRHLDRADPRENDHVFVEVGDTGAGLRAELRQKIFERLFTTKPVGRGAGRGLDISYRVITQRHGGDLRVVWRPGDTWFQVRLPIAEPLTDPDDERRVL